MWTQERLTLLQSQILRRSMNEQDYYTVIAMKRRGGSFVVKLAELAERADPSNLNKIKIAWSGYWAEYSAIGKQIKEEQPYLYENI